MDTTPQVPKDTTEVDTQTARGPRALAETMSWGEQLLPLTYAAMEACWIDALLIGLVRLHILGSTTLFMPLWAPFLITIVSVWLALALPDQNVQSRRRGSSSATILFIQGVMAIGVVWASLYTLSAAIWSPLWIIALASDAFQLNNMAFATIGIIILIAVFCYRGIHIARYALEPSETTRSIIVGSIILLVVSLLPASSSNEQVDLLGLFLLLVTFALFARALAYTLFIRQEHLTGLQGSKAAQDRLILSTVGLICLPLLIIALVIGITVNPNFLAAIQQLFSPLSHVYDVIVLAIASLLSFLLSGLLSILPKISKGKNPNPIREPANPFTKHPTSPGHLSPVVYSIASIIFYLCLMAILIAIVVIITTLLRRRTQGKRLNLDIRESLWSWQLFKAQLLFLLRAVLHRFQTKKTEGGVQVSEQTTEGTPSQRDIRAIYRAFLQWTAQRGYRRQHNETPGEFKQRLVGHPPTSLALLEAELQTVTDIYSSTRYSQETPSTSEVERMQQNWRTIQQQAPPPA